MTELHISDVQLCINAAYQRYLLGRPGVIQVQTSIGKVNVTCEINRGRFNCGFPGYFLDFRMIDTLRHWCTTHPGDGWSFGFRGTDDRHPNNINITLIDRTELMFNFHVYLG